MLLPQIHSDPNILNSWRSTEATNYLIIHHSKFENHSIIPQSTQPSTSSSLLHLKTMAFLSATHFSLGLQQKHHENQQKSEACQPLGYCHQPGVQAWDFPPSLWCWKHQAKKKKRFLLLQYRETKHTKKRGVQRVQTSKSSNFWKQICTQWITRHPNYGTSTTRRSMSLDKANAPLGRFALKKQSPKGRLFRKFCSKIWSIKNQKTNINKHHLYFKKRNAPLFFWDGNVNGRLVVDR